MKRLFLLAVSLIAVGATAGFGEKTILARGGHSGVEHGIGSLQIDIHKGRQSYGTMQYAAEDHSARYPETIVRMTTLTDVQFKGWRAEFSGTGTFNDDAVRIKAEVQDGNQVGRPDSFSLVCTDSSGNIVFTESADLSSGDIAISGN